MGASTKSDALAESNNNPINFTNRETNGPASLIPTHQKQVIQSKSQQHVSHMFIIEGQSKSQRDPIFFFSFPLRAFGLPSSKMWP
jgi:hypothetical protein